MFNINENEKQLKNLAKKTYINIVLEIDENWHIINHTKYFIMEYVRFITHPSFM